MCEHEGLGRISDHRPHNPRIHEAGAWKARADGTETSVPQLFSCSPFFWYEENEENHQDWQTLILAGTDKAVTDVHQ